MRALAAAVALGSVGCGVSLGPAGVLAPSPDLVATKLLRPGARSRACLTSFFGFRSKGDDQLLATALARMIALDDEADVVTNVEVRTTGIVTGVYDRRCVELRGDLGRMIRTITVPVPGHEEHGSR